MSVISLLLWDAAIVLCGWAFLCVRLRGLSQGWSHCSFGSDYKCYFCHFWGNSSPISKSYYSLQRSPARAASSPSASSSSIRSVSFSGLFTTRALTSIFISGFRATPELMIRSRGLFGLGWNCSGGNARIESLFYSKRDPFRVVKFTVWVIRCSGSVLRLFRWGSFFRTILEPFLLIFFRAIVSIWRFLCLFTERASPACFGTPRRTAWTLSSVFTSDPRRRGGRSRGHPWCTIPILSGRRWDRSLSLLVSRTSLWGACIPFIVIGFFRWVGIRCDWPCCRPRGCSRVRRRGSLTPRRRSGRFGSSLLYWPGGGPVGDCVIIGSSTRGSF